MTSESITLSVLNLSISTTFFLVLHKVKPLESSHLRSI